jgi:16S rRNA (guanine966-N2)-methyltransferase
VRIVGGRLGGRRLAGPSAKGTRPTSDRAREGIASALEARGLIEGARVLDLFAGTGALGFEALSRGAAHVCFVDRDAGCVRAIKDNAELFGVTADIRALSIDLFREGALERISADPPFDLLFADPPYAEIAKLGPVLEELFRRGRLTTGAALVLEHARRDSPVLPEGFGEIASYRYGDTAVVLCLAPKERT